MPFSIGHPVFDLTPDGRRIIALERQETEAKVDLQVMMLLNWFDELRRCLPPWEVSEEVLPKSPSQRSGWIVGHLEITLTAALMHGCYNLTPFATCQLSSPSNSTIERVFRVTEHTNLQLLAEGSNLLNRTNYASVNNQVGSNFALPLSSAGQGFTTFKVHGSSALSPSQPLGFTSAFPKRPIQLGLRLTF